MDLTARIAELESLLEAERKAREAAEAQVEAERKAREAAEAMVASLLSQCRRLGRLPDVTAEGVQAADTALNWLEEKWPREAKLALQARYRSKASRIGRGDIQDPQAFLERLRRDLDDAKQCERIDSGVKSLRTKKQSKARKEPPQAEQVNRHEMCRVLRDDDIDEILGGGLDQQQVKRLLRTISPEPVAKRIVSVFVMAERYDIDGADALRAAGFHPADFQLVSEWFREALERLRMSFDDCIAAIRQQVPDQLIEAAADILSGWWGQPKLETVET